MSPILSAKSDVRASIDLSRENLDEIFSEARRLKADLKQGKLSNLMAGKAMALVFEKPSLRTRCTFELGMQQLGGFATYLSPQEIGIGTRESVYDIAHNLERWYDIIVARTFAQATIDELVTESSIPVINALSDDDHPCQALADYLTLMEKVGDLKGFRLTWVGDGNNVCNALMIVGARMGVEMTVCTPADYKPAANVINQAHEIADAHGTKLHLTEDPTEAVEQAQAIYTDTWISMGQEEEAKERVATFQPYQVNAELVKQAPEGVFIMHDLPAYRGKEITDEVIDSPNSIVFDQAENRLHAQKGAIAFLQMRSKG